MMPELDPRASFFRVLPTDREVASWGLGAWGAGLAQLAFLYALGIIGALCAYGGYAVFALLVQARRAPHALCQGVGKSLTQCLLYHQGAGDLCSCLAANCTRCMVLPATTPCARTMTVLQSYMGCKPGTCWPLVG
jgi:hypothetical protein